MKDEFDFESIEIPEYTSVPPVYIITHGRPELCKKHTTMMLQKGGFSGKIVYVLDDEDTTIDQYRKLPGEVEIFSKKELVDRKDFDFIFPHTGEIYKSTLYARVACFDIARRRGDKYFCVMDDDYDAAIGRMRMSQKTLDLKNLHNFDILINLTFDLLKSTDAAVVAWSQTGDTLTNKVRYTNLRKAMNVFFFDVDRAYRFPGVFNEDVSAYVNEGRAGKLILTVPFILIHQIPTQKAKGGFTEMYKRFGTYVKSFCSVVVSPSAVMINRMGETKETFRIHHQVKWEHCSPRILAPDWEQRMKEKGYVGTRVHINKKRVKTKSDLFFS